MSQYLDLFSAIDDMSVSGIQSWISLIGTPRHVGITFRGLQVDDAELLEALINELPKRTVRHNVFDQTHPFVD